MDKLKTHRPDLSQETIPKIHDLLPDRVTEARDEATGTLRLAVDFDQLRQQLSDRLVEGSPMGSLGYLSYHNRSRTVAILDLPCPPT